MTSDGSPWRPLVHALDIGKAIRCVLEAPREAVHAEVFNVGSDEQNYQVREIAEIVADTFPGCTISFGEHGADNRSYQVDFDEDLHQAAGLLLRLGRRQRRAAAATTSSRSIDLDEETFTGRGHTRLKQLEHLLTHQAGRRRPLLDGP